MGGRVAGNDGWVNAVAHEVGPGVTVSTQPGSFTVHLPCPCCSTDKEYLIPRKYPPAVIRKKLEQQGWRTGKHLACPTCVKMRRKPARHDSLAGQLSRLAVVAAISGAEAVAKSTPPSAAPVPAAPAPAPAPAAQAPVLPAPTLAPAPVTALAWERARQQVPAPAATPATSAGPPASTPAKLTVAQSLRALASTVPQTPLNAAVLQAAQVAVAAPAQAAKAQSASVQQQAQGAAQQQQAEENTKVGTVAAINQSPAAPTEAARAARRKAMELLEAQFELSKGRYKPDAKGPYSDKRVAEESGVSPEQVAEQRLQFFGELREPVEFEALQMRALEFEEGLRALDTAVAKARADAEVALERVLQPVLERRKTLDDQLRKLSTELEHTARKNGWL